jgi:hypothetical protein
MTPITLRQENDALRNALVVAQQAINDWLHIYASDMCSPERVEEAVERVHEHGTLSYIAGISEIIRAAVATKADDPQPIGYCSEYGIRKLSERIHFQTVSVSVKPENEYVIPIYTPPDQADNGKTSP